MTHDKYQSFFDELAAEWDSSFTAVDFEYLEFLVSGMGTQAGWDVLDLGCGTGVLFDLLRRQTGQEGSVTGVDLSIKMAMKAHRNFPFANVNVVSTDVSELPFSDNSFDMAVAFASFPHFSDQGKAIEEIHRVLRSSALLHIVHLKSSLELSNMHHKVGGPVSDDALPTETELRAMFESSSFVDVSIRDHSGLYFASAQNLK